jgi:uncharacterized BrkB/YihY/UPF0761 family membrane protein
LAQLAMQQRTSESWRRSWHRSVMKRLAVGLLLLTVLTVGACAGFKKA